MDNFIILGGGTAGLVTALILRKSFPQYPVTIIESSEIGIIGVGEGSTEHWSDFCRFCEIDKAELVRETDATLKKGIRFDNWNGDGKFYYHSIGGPFWESTDQMLMPRAVMPLGINIEDITVDTNLVTHQGGIHSTNQYHFNTFKLNEYLHKKCSQRNINIVNAKIVDVKIKQDGDIQSIVSEDGMEYTASFFIDSTGFKRVLSSKLGAKWVSYGKYLPMNHAIAFPTEDASNLVPHTLSRALSSGWNWRIPTQSRYGNGYVFCDDFINVEQAIAEVQSVYTEKVNVAKDIKFEAGRVDKFWINNCLSVGLSASFVEPLEASSIGNSILQAFGFCQMYQNWVEDRKISAQYDKVFIECFDNIVDFVQLHYMTKRNDTPFWRELQHRMVKTDFMEQHLESFKRSLPAKTWFQGEWKMFSYANWTQVMFGLGMLDLEHIKTKFNLSHGEKVVQEQLELYNRYNSDLQKSSFLDHKTLLEQNKIVLNINYI